MNRYAVLISNSNFPAHDGLIDLQTPANDARALKKILQDRGGFDVRPLTDGLRQDMSDLIEGALNEATEGDLVLIYYSGHGLLDDDAHLYLAAHDAAPEMMGRSQPFAEVASRIGLSKCRRIVVLLDCCFSGAAGHQFEIRGGVSLEQISRFAQQEGYEEDGEHRGPAASLDGTSSGDGLYLMTACSATQQAKSKISEGHGVFTKGLIDSFAGGAHLKHPTVDEKKIVTVRSLFGHVATELKESGQTPMLWSRDQSTPDLILSEIDLEGKNRPGILPRERWPLLRETRSSVLPHVGPTYILDNAFRFVEWNPAFEDLVATPLGLTRGIHADEFLKGLSNRRKVRSRSLRVFTPGRFPAVDIEIFKLKTRLGKVVFHKIASQIRDSDGNRVAWAVNLNVSRVRWWRRRRFWQRLEFVMNREANWSKYAHSYDPIIGSFPEYQKLVDLVTGMVGAARNCLDLGAGTGNATIELLESELTRSVRAIEGNAEMLEKLDQKLAAKPELRNRTTLLKGDIVSCLREEQDDSYDACVMLNVLFSLDDPGKCLSEIYRVLEPGGVLALSTSHDETDLDNLFSEIHISLKSRGLIPQQEEAWEDAWQRNISMKPSIQRQSKNLTREMILGAGFSIAPADWHDSEFVDCVVAVRAIKPHLGHDGVGR